jgi:hypothetical protein
LQSRLAEIFFLEFGTSLAPIFFTPTFWEANDNSHQRPSPFHKSCRLLFSPLFLIAIPMFALQSKKFPRNTELLINNRFRVLFPGFFVEEIIVNEVETFEKFGNLSFEVQFCRHSLQYAIVPSTHSFTTLLKFISTPLQTHHAENTFS